MKTVALLLVLAGLMLPPPCGAADADPEAVEAAYEHQPIEFVPRKFFRQRVRLEREMRTSEKYAGLTADDFERVKVSLDKMGALLEGVVSIDDMPYDKRVELFNEQETINTVLTQANENNRLICERQQRTGSHMTRTQCISVRDRELARERGKDVLRDALRRPILQNEGPGGG